MNRRRGYSPIPIDPVTGKPRMVTSTSAKLWRAAMFAGIGIAIVLGILGTIGFSNSRTSDGKIDSLCVEDLKVTGLVNFSTANEILCQNWTLNFDSFVVMYSWSLD